MTETSPGNGTESHDAATESWKPLQPWTLAERWGDHRIGWWLLFKNGDERLEIDVHEQAWRAFDR